MDDLATWLSADYPRAYRTACLILRNPADAEEAVQDAFLRAWRFRAAAPADVARQAWLYRVVVNTCCSKLRTESRHRDRRANDDVLESWASNSSTPEDAALRSETQVAVIAALGRLPEALRIPVVLRYYAGLTEREIAVAIHRRPGTVKSRLHDARTRLAADPMLSGLVEATGGMS